MEKRNYFEHLISSITTLRELIRINYPEKFEELRQREDRWFQISMSNYQTWIDENIELEKDNPVSIAIYSTAFGQTMEEVLAYLASKEQTK